VRRGATIFGFIAASCAAASGGAAHGFGQRYDLPLPLPLYLLGTAAAIIASFLIVGLVPRHKLKACDYPRITLFGPPHPAALGTLRALGVGLFLLIVTAGFIGDQDPYRNLAPTLVWIVWWVGLALFSAFVGNLWALVNPWRSLFDGADRLCRAIFGRVLCSRLSYPEALGVWPAVLSLFAVSWIELVFPSPALPANIALFALAYSLLTWVGMALFGVDLWLRRGEVFAVFFGLFARFAPTEAKPHGGLALRPFGAGLLAAELASVSTVAFILMALASVLFDGVLTTPEWSAVESGMTALVPVFGSMAIRTFGLAAFWALFLGVYIAVCGVMSVVAGTGSAWGMARQFAFSLVPIAIAYHLAHYLSYLLTQGQYVIPLVSDPFGIGWDLFGTADYRVDIAVVGARFAWYGAVSAIVIGHIAAVYLADVRARRVLPTRRAAFRSQVPLTALMVVYTFVSLSILSEPIVERRAPATPSAQAPQLVAIPADAVLPEVGTGRLVLVGPGRSAPLKLTYRMMGSAFHDGSQMAVADLLYAYMFVYRWSGGDGSSLSDEIVVRATAPLRQRLLAVRVAGIDKTSNSFRVADVSFTRELFIVEVYLDIQPGDPEQDAAFAPPWSAVPWHLLVLMDEAGRRGWAAFSQAEAARRGVEWLDLVRSDTLKPRLAGLIEEFERDGYRPDILKSLVSANEARRRWAAFAAFYKAHAHFLVTNGPYALKSWQDDKVTLDVFRDLTYPLGVGSFDTYAIPRRGFVVKAERDPEGLRITADIETIMKFMRDYELVRQPMASLDAVTLRRAAPECRYIVVDADNAVALAGVVQPQEDHTFRIPLDGRVPVGNYKVIAEILVNGNGMQPEIAKVPVTVGPVR
jgi:hypothetical protein